MSKTTTALTVVKPTTKPERVASWVSNIAAPPVLMVVSAVLVALETAGKGAWEWALFFGVVAVILPLLYVVWEVYRGNISDVHIPDREQRFRPFVVALVASLSVWVIFALYPAPPMFRMLALANGLQTLVFFVITLRWKISLHSAAAASLTVLGWAAFSSTGLWLLLTVPIVAWARRAAAPAHAGANGRRRNSRRGNSRRGGLDRVAAGRESRVGSRT